MNLYGKAHAEAYVIGLVSYTMPDTICGEEIEVTKNSVNDDLFESGIFGLNI